MNSSEGEGEGGESDEGEGNEGGGDEGEGEEGEGDEGEGDEGGGGATEVAIGSATADNERVLRQTLPELVRMSDYLRLEPPAVMRRTEGHCQESGLPRIVTDACMQDSDPTASYVLLRSKWTAPTLNNGATDACFRIAKPGGKRHGRTCVALKAGSTFSGSVDSVITGLKRGKTHSLALRSILHDANGTVGRSEAATLEVGPIGRPKRPKLQVVGTGKRNVSLSWTSADAPVSYRVRFRALSSAGEWHTVDTLHGHQTEYVVRNLEADTRYRFRVRAANEFGERDSNPVTVDTTKKGNDKEPTRPTSPITPKAPVFGQVDYSYGSDGDWCVPITIHEATTAKVYIYVTWADDYGRSGDFWSSTTFSRNDFSGGREVRYCFKGDVGDHMGLVARAWNMEDYHHPDARSQDSKPKTFRVSK